MQRADILVVLQRNAERLAGEIAIDCAGRSLTYAELEGRSNRIANRLFSSGARKGSTVVVLSSDTANVITALLGILKAGCVFVPLDPRTPARRLRAMISEVAAQWLLTEPPLFDLADDLWDERDTGPRRVCLEHWAAPLDCRPGVEHAAACDADWDYENPDAALTPDDLCYIYFTSGSTGGPKGIAGRLKGVEHFVGWEIETFGLGEGVRVSQLTTPSFDAFLRDAFVPLRAGGTVCALDDRQIALDPAKLLGWIERLRVNLVHCVPSLFRSLLGVSPPPSGLPHLDYVLMSGEPLLPRDVRRWVDGYGERTRLVNLYGPTETTMTKFFYVVRPADAERAFIPIGKPMSGAAALIVNADGGPCPRGAVGEIFIRTPFRTLGYYNHPELTAERFIRNPFNDDPRDIVYRTGDLGRVLEDGNFQFLGRLDHQVKIRGQRVELSEIENALLEFAPVKDAAVVDRDDASGDRFLCAYVVARDRIDTGELSRFLSGSLPAYMVPSAFVVMDALPRTTSGKIDRGALPEPTGRESRVAREYVAPRTETEEALARIWSEALGVERVGVEDDFFQLGGHSLLLAQVAARIQSALGVELPLQEVFKAPTIGPMAEAVERAVLANADASRVDQLLDMLERLDEDGAEKTFKHGDA